MKVVLARAVLRDKLRVYPWIIDFLLISSLCQDYELFIAYSWGLALLTVFAIFIVWLTWHGYKAHVGPPQQQPPGHVHRHGGQRLRRRRRHTHSSLESSNKTKENSSTYHRITATGRSDDVLLKTPKPARLTS